MRRPRTAPAKADVSTIGKEIATYYVDGTGAPTLAVASGSYTLTGTATGATAQSLGKQSAGMGTPTLTATGTGTASPTAWCVTLPITTGGTLANVYYSNANGLSTTSC